MNTITVTGMAFSIKKGLVELSKKQYLRAEHALVPVEPIKNKDDIKDGALYYVLDRIGFKKGEVFKYSLPVSKLDVSDVDIIEGKNESDIDDSGWEKSVTKKQLITKIDMLLDKGVDIEYKPSDSKATLIQKIKDAE